MKNFLITFGILYFFCVSDTVAENLKIITREEWGADETYTDLHSSYWQDIITERIKIGEETGTEAQESSYARQKVKNKKRVDYINKNFANRYVLSGKKTYNDQIQLAWPVSYSKNIDAILLHHTYSEYNSSEEGIKNIYKHHSLGNQWGDIGYNYVIGYNGEIYEGRLGGDYAIGAHATWNNYSTMGVTVMGNYNIRELNSQQYYALQRLLGHLIYKYDISMDKKIPFHHVCHNCEDGLETHYFEPIAGHKDGGNTSCPGENLYNEISSFNNQFKREQNYLNEMFQKFENNIGKMSGEKTQIINKKIQELSTKNLSEKSNYILRNISKILSEKF